MRTVRVSSHEEQQPNPTGLKCGGMTRQNLGIARGANPLGGEAQTGGYMDQLKLFDEPQREYTSDDYWTPKWVFDTLGIEFDLDVACPPEGPAHTPCKRFYTQADDGLIAPWEGCVWMNPPFSKPQKWVQKFIDHGNGIALTPMAKSRWFNQLWEVAHGVIPLPSNMKFVQGGIFMPVMLSAFGDKCVDAIANIGRVR